MGLSGWVGGVLSAVAGLYLIIVELGAAEKTPLVLYVGLILFVPLIILTILSMVKK